MTAPEEDVERDLLRVVACGSVDDGKSTLIGRLLFETGAAPDDVVEQVRRDSAAAGLAALDWSFLVDGLEAEREQGVTIDVAHRRLSTPRRTFALADAPGHEQHTRNMAVAASTADLALLLVDARKGVLTQTRRHAAIAALLGVRQAMLAVNKMDLVGWDEATFRRIAAKGEALARRLGLTLAAATPLCARDGDNLVRRSEHAPWFDGPTLLEALEAAPAAAPVDGPFRFPVQSVLRGEDGLRLLAGTVASGAVRPGDAVVVAASGWSARVERIVTADGDLAEAPAGEAVALVLAGDVEAGRGDLLCDPRARPTVSPDFAARLIWMAEAPLSPGANLLLKLGAKTVGARVAHIRVRLSVDDLSEAPAGELALNDIGRCELLAAEPLAFDRYAENRRTGGFILIDRTTGATVAAGLVEGGLSRASNVHPQESAVRRADREQLAGHRGLCVWLTGLSGAGKSTLAGALEARLHARGVRTLTLDGDNLRHGLNRDLGFAPADRAENVRRTAEAARLIVESGAVAVVALVSPLAADREAARALFAEGDFVEVFVDAPVALCAERDPKGLYARALRGEIPDFTGVSAPYEAPAAPALVIDTSAMGVGAAVDRLAALLEPRLWFPP